MYVRKYHVVIEANLQRLQPCDSEMLVEANSKLCMVLIIMSIVETSLRFCVIP